MVRKPVRALKSLLQEAGITHVDFLKIDAEGAEADVIAGMDWGDVRPRVIVIEAEVPGTMPEAWRAWEPSAGGRIQPLLSGQPQSLVCTAAGDRAPRTLSEHTGRLA